MLQHFDQMHLLQGRYRKLQLPETFNKCFGANLDVIRQPLPNGIGCEANKPDTTLCGLRTEPRVSHPEYQKNVLTKQ